MKYLKTVMFVILCSTFVFSCNKDYDTAATEPSSTQVGIDIDELVGIDYSGAVALSSDIEEGININGIFENPYTNNGIEDLPVLIIKDEALLFGYFPHTMETNKVSIDDILLFYFLIYPQIAIQGPDYQLLINEIKLSSNYEEMKDLVISNLNNNTSALTDKNFLNLIKEFTSKFDSKSYLKSSKSTKEVVGTFRFDYDRSGKVQWTKEVPLFSAMGLAIKDVANNEIVFGPELLATKNLEISSSSVAGWIANEFGTPIPPATNSYTFEKDGEYEILLTNGHSSNVELDLAINARNASQYASTAVGMVLTAGLKTIAGSDECREAIANFHAQQITYVTGLIISNKVPTQDDLLKQLTKSGSEFFVTVDNCIAGNAFTKFMKFIGAAVLGVLNATLDVSELIFMMRDYFGSEILVTETRYYEDGVSFGQLFAEQISSSNVYEGNNGDSFEFTVSVSEKVERYKIDRGLSSSEFIPHPINRQAEGIPFNVVVTEGNAAITTNPVISGEPRLDGNLIIPFTIGCDPSKITVSPPQKSKGIQDFVISTKTNHAIQLVGDLSFGEVNVNTPVTKTLTINNPSCKSINISSISLPNGYSTDYEGGTIQASSSINVDIAFSPTLAEEYAGTLIVMNDVDQVNNRIEVSGVGIGNPSLLSLSGDLDFGEVPINTSKELVLTVKVDGDNPIEIYSLILPEGYKSDWSQGILQGNSSKDISVTFTPTNIQDYPGTITLLNDTDQVNNAIFTSGSGIDFILIIENTLVIDHSESRDPNNTTQFEFNRVTNADGQSIGFGFYPYNTKHSLGFGIYDGEQLLRTGTHSVKYEDGHNFMNVQVTITETDGYPRAYWSQRESSGTITISRIDAYEPNTGGEIHVTFNNVELGGTAHITISGTIKARWDN